MLRTIIFCLVARALLQGCISHPEPPIVQYRTQYHFPLASPGSKFGALGVKLSELPPAVSKTLHDRAPNPGIASVNKETWGVRVVYIVSFSDPTHHPRLYLAADGTVLNEGPN